MCSADLDPIRAPELPGWVVWLCIRGPQGIVSVGGDVGEGGDALSGHAARWKRAAAAAAAWKLPRSSLAAAKRPQLLAARLQHLGSQHFSSRNAACDPGKPESWPQPRAAEEPVAVARYRGRWGCGLISNAPLRAAADARTREAALEAPHASDSVFFLRCHVRRTPTHSSRPGGGGGGGVYLYSMDTIAGVHSECMGRETHAHMHTRITSDTHSGSGSRVRTTHAHTYVHTP